MESNIEPDDLDYDNTLLEELKSRGVDTLSTEEIPAELLEEAHEATRKILGRPRHS